MEHDEYLAALRQDADGFAAAIALADPAAQVRACPDWTVSDLLWHLTEVHDFWRAVVVQRIADPATEYVDPVRPGGHADLLAMFRSGADELIAALTNTDPSTIVWSWTPAHHVGFVLRRMAHETSIHRWDAEDAAGRTFALDPAFASDGIDEFLEYFAGYAYAPGTGPEPVGGTTHVHCTDVPGEWLIVDGLHGRMVITRQHAKGDCAIRGAAGDILLGLWRRLPLDELEVIGDASVAARFIAHTGAN
jgi:uncharacterized protein (TIGR03083 family)